MKRPPAVAALLLSAAPLAAGEPPAVSHQPIPCTLAERPFSLCANITDDGQVAKARVYFRPAGEKFYSYVDMAFGGLNFCATLPAPRTGRTKAVEYYVQAIDDEYDTQRTSTHLVNILPEGVCEFPPVETDPARTSSITVFATHRNQGQKLPDAFQREGVSFVPAGRR